MEYFTIKNALTGDEMTARFIGAVDAPAGDPPECWDLGLTGQGTPAGKALMRCLSRGRADDAADVIAETGYGMRGDLAWDDAQTLNRLADSPQAAPAVISRGGDAIFSGVRVSVCRGIAYVRARGMVHLFGVCPDYA